MLPPLGYKTKYRKKSLKVTHVNRQLHERLCVVKEDKISRLSANQSMPNTNATGTAVNGLAQIATNTDKLVVTIPEDLPLHEHERSLLAKGVNSINTTSVTDEFPVKEDNENFLSEDIPGEQTTTSSLIPSLVTLPTPMPLTQTSSRTQGQQVL